MLNIRLKIYLILKKFNGKINNFKYQYQYRYYYQYHY